MSRLLETFSIPGISISLTSQVYNILTTALDITIVAILIYFIFKILSKSERLLMILNSFLLFIALYVLAEMLNLTTLKNLLSTISAWIVVIIFILFQKEIREALEKMGSLEGMNKKRVEEKVGFITELKDAVYELASTKTGALITIQREFEMTEYTKRANKIDAEFSKALIQIIFNKESVMHDGAVVINNNRIMYASTYYPISLELNLDKKYGTRHRAAMTISGETDSVTIVVSEETGAVSFAYHQRLYDDVSPQFFEEFLNEKI